VNSKPHISQPDSGPNSGPDNDTLSSAQWGIQDFAGIFKITPRTLRFYEDKGLISPERQNGSRVFGPRDYVRTERIIRAKDLGFSLGDIKDLFEVIDGQVRGKNEAIFAKTLVDSGEDYNLGYPARTAQSHS